MTKRAFILIVILLTLQTEIRPHNPFAKIHPAILVPLIVGGTFIMPGIMFGGGEIARDKQERSSFWPVYVNANLTMLGTGIIYELVRSQAPDFAIKYDNVMFLTMASIIVAAGAVTYRFNLHPVDRPQGDIFLPIGKLSF